MINYFKTINKLDGFNKFANITTFILIICFSIVSVLYFSTLENTNFLDITLITFLFSILIFAYTQMISSLIDNFNKKTNEEKE